MLCTSLRQGLRGEVYWDGLSWPHNGAQDRQGSGEALAQSCPSVRFYLPHQTLQKLEVEISSVCSSYKKMPGKPPWKSPSFPVHMKQKLPVHYETSFSCSSHSLSLSFHFLSLLFLFYISFPKQPDLGLQLKPVSCPLPQSLDVGRPSLASLESLGF